jgi:hypothetical protein
LLVLVVASLAFPSKLTALTQQDSGAVGVEGTVPSSPPTKAATISVPSNGQTFTNLPITVSGLCTKGLLVEIFKNEVFAGSTQCSNGSYSLQIDLFDGRNDLIARLYDSLNQTSPDSNTVSVTLRSNSASSSSRVSLITSFAKRGATPGDPLSWPLTLSGGSSPYALTIDWGDKSAPDLLSRAAAGDFTIEHTYLQSGLYNVTIKATDVNGSVAFLQVVGVGNGPIQQTTASTKNGGSGGQGQTKILWWPFLLTIGLLVIAFWAGQQHQLEAIRDRLRRGERPFK